MINFLKLGDFLFTFNGIIFIFACLITIMGILLFIAAVTKKDSQESIGPVIEDEKPNDDLPNDDFDELVVVESPVEKLTESIPNPKRVYKKKPKE